MSGRIFTSFSVGRYTIIPAGDEPPQPCGIPIILGKKGALTLTRSGLAFSIKELGTCLRDASDICTGNVEWYGEGSQYWAENISLYQLHFPGNLEADETTLWLSRDMNTDGDTDDAGEEIIFERI